MLHTFYSNQKFTAEAVDGMSLMTINETDLKDLKIKIGPRKRILQIIAEASHVVS